MPRAAVVAFLIMLASCAHGGAVATHPPIEPELVPGAVPSGPMPDSLVVAFTDSADSLLAHLVAGGHYQRADNSSADGHLIPVVPGSAPPLVVKWISPRAARDALDVGVDVLITADPAAVSYAAARADLISIPLAWTHSYVLFTPGRSLPDGTPSADSLLAGLRAELAAYAVRAEARPAALDDSCALGITAALAPVDSPQPLTPRIVYERDDDVARALATRLVALASEGESGSGAVLAAIAPTLAAAGVALRADGLSAADFAAALAARRATAFVLALPAPISANGACTPDSTLVRRAPWAIAPRRNAVALVDTRARILARRTVTRLPFTWLGAPPDTAGPAR